MGGAGEAFAQELTHQGGDESEDMQQPVQDFGGALGLLPEDAVDQQGCRASKGKCCGPLPPRAVLPAWAASSSSA